jgi:acyl-CoA dehydrogenase
VQATPSAREETAMEFEFSKKTKMYQEQLVDFMGKHVYPNEQTFVDQMAAQSNRWQVPPIMEELKARARERGLWNLFLPESELGAGLTNLEYAPLCEIMGRSPIAPEVFNCAAPDTGNMEVLVRYGTAEQKKQWLEPLLEGKIRSAFAMTEPKVASSDATNIEASIVRDGDSYVINAHKWWTSGIGDPRCKILIFMGKTDAKNPDRYKQQSMILVPRDTPGIKVLRMLTVFGYDDAPHGHGEVLFENVRVPASNMLLGEGRGFEIAQGRLGPGRIHHCMRQIGVAERALELMCKRAHERVAFGKRLSDNDISLERIAQSRIEIDQARLLVLNAAWMMDTAGNKAAKQAIASIKVAVPNMTLGVVDRAMQMHGGGGVSQAFPLAFWWAHSRTLRFADGPDEVHRRQIGRLELRKYF